jgi:hypothetical protein
MATRSLVARRNSDATYTAIYVHWDGYVAGVGCCLQQHYADDSAVAALLALGALSELGVSIGAPHTFAEHDQLPYTDDEFPTWCLAYGRDRGDTTDGAGAPWVLPDTAALIQRARDWDGEYVYVWHACQWWLLGRDGALRAFDGPAARAAEFARTAAFVVA